MKKYKKYIVLIVVAILLSICGFTFAKYAYNSVWDYYLKSKGFYFYSNQLDSDVVKNVDNLWNGESVHFNIKNNLNQTVATNYDITYTTVCTIQGDVASHAECHIDGTGLNTKSDVLTKVQICINTTGDEIDTSSYTEEECGLGGYNWISQVVTKDHYFDIVLTDPEYELKDVTVSIEATSTSPYHKVISGDFMLHKVGMEEDKLTLNYKNYSKYNRLVVFNSYSSTKCVSITWDSNKLLINAENTEFSSYGVDSNNYINQIKFNIPAKKSLNYMFYSKDFNQIYDVSEFSIEETSGC